MASEIDICNIALSRIGNDRMINSLNEQSKEAGACSLHYAACRDAVLSDFPWNFAMKRVALADLGTAQPDWDYCYRYPNDCLRLIEIMVHGIRFPTQAMKIPYEIASDGEGTGKLLLTNQCGAWVRYVGRMTDTNMFDTLFCDAISWRLASEIAMPITRSTDAMNLARQMYLMTLNSAWSRSMNESQEPVAPDCDFITARLS